MVATSIAVSRPSWFCEHGPVSVSFANAAHCVGVRLIPISRAKIVAWRCHTWRRMKPICSSSTYGGGGGFLFRLSETFLVICVPRRWIMIRDLIGSRSHLCLFGHDLFGKPVAAFP